MVKEILRPEKKISVFSSGKKWCRYLTLDKRGPISGPQNT
jgi:hypothetical protein